MSEVDIRSGGVVAVDTLSLRRAGDAAAALGLDLDAIRARLRDAAARLSAADDLLSRTDAAARRADALGDEAARLAASLRESADVYELAELLAAREVARAGGDGAGATTADGRIALLVSEHPLAGLDATARVALWRLAGPGELLWQAAAVPFSAAQLPLLLAMIGVAGYAHGRVAGDSVITGPAPPVQLRRIEAAAPSAPPRNLADAVAHMPRDPAQVRVERYAMPDGSRRFALYVAGTQSVFGATQPWNMTSNRQLYSGEKSASYAAAAEALRAAGARPGDAVYAFGHSQGAMIAGRIALQEGYDAKALVTFGSPQSFDVGDDTLSVQVRHADDPVVALSDGGHPERVGAEGSFIAERVADPLPGLDDLGLEAHHLETYAETAREVDAADDVRVERMREMFAELDSAASVDVFDYEATPIGLPEPHPRPGPAPLSPSSGGAG